MTEQQKPEVPKVSNPHVANAIEKMKALKAEGLNPQERATRQAEILGELTAKVTADKKNSAPDLDAIRDEIKKKIASGEIQLSRMGIGGASLRALEGKLDLNWDGVSDNARAMLQDMFFQTEYRELKNGEEKVIYLITLTVGDMGFPHAVNYESIMARAGALGYSKCPPVVGMYLFERLRNANPVNKTLYVGMDLLEHIPAGMPAGEVAKPRDSIFLIGGNGTNGAATSNILGDIQCRPENGFGTDCMFVFER